MIIRLLATALAVTLIGKPACARAVAEVPIELSTTAPRPQTELLSITAIPLAADDYVDGFDIKTQGVEIIAVCHIPYGWRLTAGIYDSVEGNLHGEAGLGVSFVSAKANNFDQMNDMFLIAVYDYTEKWDGTLPPTFRATASIGRYGTDQPLQERSLDPAKLHRVAATRCPAPRR